MKDRIHALYLVGNSLNSGDVAYDDSRNCIGRNMGITRSFNQCILEDVVPSFGLGFEGLPIINHPFGVRRNVQMQLTMSIRPRPSFLAFRDMELGFRYLEEVWGASISYIGFPDADNDTYFKKIMTKSYSAWNPWNWFGDPRKAEFMAQINACIEPYRKLRTLVALDCCTDVPPGNALFPQAWHWWADWAAEHIDLVAGVETFWHRQSTKLYELPVFVTSEAMQRIDAGLAQDWAYQPEDMPNDTIYVMAGSTNPRIPGPQLNGDEQQYKDWCNLQLSFGRRICISPDHCIRNNQNVLDWLGIRP